MKFNIKVKKLLWFWSIPDIILGNPWTINTMAQGPRFEVLLEDVKKTMFDNKQGMSIR